MEGFRVLEGIRHGLGHGRREFNTVLDLVVGDLHVERFEDLALVSAVPPDGSTAVSLELWVASQAVQLIARYRCDGVTGEPPDLHPGAIALVERCAPHWSAERTVSETVVRARRDLARLTGRA